MARITENAVLVNKAGDICGVKLVNDPENNRKKSRTFYNVQTGQDIDGTDVTPLKITDITSLKAFVLAYNMLPVEPRGGYDAYYNTYGPTNPKSCNELSLQGQVKMAAVFINAILRRIAKNNGADTEDARNALSLIQDFVNNGFAEDPIDAAGVTDNNVVINNTVEVANV